MRKFFPAPEIFHHDLQLMARSLFVLVSDAEPHSFPYTLKKLIEKIIQNQKSKNPKKKKKKKNHWEKNKTSPWRRFTPRD